MGGLQGHVRLRAHAEGERRRGEIGYVEGGAHVGDAFAHHHERFGRDQDQPPPKKALKAASKRTAPRAKS